MRNPILTLIISFLIVSACNKDEKLSTNYFGTWLYTSTCGGFTGLCSYPNDNYKQSLEISNLRIIKKINDSIAIDSKYTFQDEMIFDQYITGRFVFEDNTYWRFILTNSFLEIEGGDFYDNYKRPFM
jgi:hypothetical protein